MKLRECEAKSIISTITTQQVKDRRGCRKNDATNKPEVKDLKNHDVFFCEERRDRILEIPFFFIFNFFIIPLRKPSRNWGLKNNPSFPQTKRLKRQAPGRGPAASRPPSRWSARSPGCSSLSRLEGGAGIIGHITLKYERKCSRNINWNWNMHTQSLGNSDRGSSRENLGFYDPWQLPQEGILGECTQPPRSREGRFMCMCWIQRIGGF